MNKMKLVINCGKKSRGKSNGFRGKKFTSK